MNKTLYWKFISFLLIVFVGCGLFRGIGSDIGEGVSNSVSLKADTIGYGLVAGARKSLASPATKQQLDSTISQLGVGLNSQLRAIRDSLLGSVTKNRVGELRDDLLGDTSIHRLLAVRDSFFNDYLQHYLNQIAAQLGPRILNESTLQKLGDVRDTLLGRKSNILMRAIADSAMSTFVLRWNREITPGLKRDLNFIERYAASLIILVGIIAIVVSWFIWRQKEKYLRMAKLLTVQVSEFADKNAKEILKDNISKNAKAIGIEDELRELLQKLGLLHMHNT